MIKDEPVTIWHNGVTYTGGYVRHYGDKVQIRLTNESFANPLGPSWKSGNKLAGWKVGDKLTGKVVLPQLGMGKLVDEARRESYVAPVVPLKTQSIMPRLVKEKPVQELGKCQHAVLELLKLSPRASFREIAKSCEVTIPRAATIVKSLVIKGRLKKTFIEGRNNYEVLP